MANIDKPRVYFLPAYAPGHLISMLEVAKSLLQSNPTSSYSFSIHILLPQPKNNPDEASSISCYIQSIEAQNLPIHFHLLPFVEPPHQSDSVRDLATLYVRPYLSHVKAALSASPSPISGLVVNLFASDAIDIAHELNIPSYIYFTSTATFLSLMLHFSRQPGKTEQINFLEVEEDICVPGLIPIPSKSMPTPLLDMKSASSKCLYHARRYLKANGIIINSSIPTFALRQNQSRPWLKVFISLNQGGAFPKYTQLGRLSLLANSRNHARSPRYTERQRDREKEVEETRERRMKMSRAAKKAN